MELPNLAWGVVETIDKEPGIFNSRNLELIMSITFYPLTSMIATPLSKKQLRGFRKSYP